MSNIKVDYDILNQKQTPAFYASSLATRPAFGFPGRIFIDTDTPSSGIYRDTGSAWVQVADPGAGTTGTLQQVTTNGNTTTLGVTIQGIDINDGAGTGVSNTAIGLAALQLNTTGAYNTAIGYGTLQANTTGGNNVATGYYSLFANTTGVNNVAIGYQSLNANTTGSANTGVGYLSLSANTTAGSNTSIGHEALRNNTTGAQNTAIGHQALRINTTGQYNVSVGQDSLANNIIGSNNTAIGQGSLRNNTAANNTAVGSGSLTLNTTGLNNTAIGHSSMGANLTGSYNAALGLSSLASNTTGSYNVAIGQSAVSSNTTGANNTAVGYQSLQSNTTGDNNTALGLSALSGNTTASSNTAIGSSSLLNNTTGAQNTAIGDTALQNNSTGASNVAIGHVAMLANTTGGANTGIGRGALVANTTGTFNVGIGYGAGGLITTGSKNSILGSYPGTTTLTNNIVLSDGDANVRLFSDANGLIGINQAVGSTIGGQLDIHSTQTYALVLNGLSTSNAYTAFSNASVGKWRIGNTYNAGANSFDIYNLGTSSNALSFNSTTNAATFISSVEASINDGSNTWAPILLMTNNSAGANDYAWGKTTINDLSLKNINNNYYPITFSNGGSYSNVGINAISPDQRFVINQSATGTGQGIPATSGTTQNGIFRLRPAIGVFGETFDFGMNVSNTYAWLQATNSSNLATNYPIAINPNGGNVLIGNTTEQLTAAGRKVVDINGTSQSILLFSTGGTYKSYIWQDGTSFIFESNIISLSSNNAERINISSAGIIKVTNLAGTGSRAVLADASGNLSAPVSDISVKQNINTIGYGLNEILKMNPVWFEYIDEYKNYGEGRQNGNIAQEMEKVIPEAVFTTPTTGKMGINYDQLHAVYIKAIQELKAEINALKNN